MRQASRGEGVSWGGVNGQEELGWVQVTLTILWTSVDRKFSSFPPVLIPVDYFLQIYCIITKLFCQQKGDVLTNVTFYNCFIQKFSSKYFSASAHQSPL